MFKLSDESLEWALIHILRFYSSDFFPTAFEFRAIKFKWSTIKPQLMGVDLDEYVPKTAITALAPKGNGTFRVVHQLEPIDVILYTALAYIVSEKIEQFRVPVEQLIACSYRIEPSVTGSFFKSDADGWNHYVDQTQKLSTRFKKGVVVILDVADFYNQIYTHRVRNVIGEAGGISLEPTAKALEHFVMGLNSQTSRGLPVGPAASIVFAEAIMGDIDRKILTVTRNFVRWVDDLRVFFANYNDARMFLHDLTAYIHENHRLLFSGEKTKILPCTAFRDQYFRDEESEERVKLKATLEGYALKEYTDQLAEIANPYQFPDELFDDDEYNAILKKIEKSDKVKALSAVYTEMLLEEIQTIPVNLTSLRQILRNAGRYRIRGIIAIVLTHFDQLLPVVREVAIYLSKVFTATLAARYKLEFDTILESPAAKIPYVNGWLAYVLQGSAFKEYVIPDIQKKVLSIRDLALIAKCKGDTVFVKTYKNNIDVLGPWDKRAVIYAASVLSKDERTHWLKAVEARDNLLESAVASFTASEK